MTVIDGDATIHEYTIRHNGGTCGGDAAECPHCICIARDLDARLATEKERTVVENRRHLPRGLGNYVVYDPYVAERRRRLSYGPDGALVIIPLGQIIRTAAR